MVGRLRCHFIVRNLTEIDKMTLLNLYDFLKKKKNLLSFLFEDDENFKKGERFENNNKGKPFMLV